MPFVVVFVVLSVDKAKEEFAPVDKQKAKDKQVKELEEKLKIRSRELQMDKMAGTVIMVVAMFALMGVLNNSFEGFPVGKLPFTPFPLIQGITHRGLSGNDMTDCSYFFIYMLCAMAVRGNVQVRPHFVGGYVMHVNGENVNGVLTSSGSVVVELFVISRDFLVLHVLVRWKQKLLGFAPSAKIDAAASFFPPPEK